MSVPNGFATGTEPTRENEPPSLAEKSSPAKTQLPSILRTSLSKDRTRHWPIACRVFRICDLPAFITRIELGIMIRGFLTAQNG